ncbi:MAG: hypothetical protein AAF485_02720 [Chloroflexota bacterium]
MPNNKMGFKKMSVVLGALLLFVLFNDATLAHVKWFTEFSFADRPLGLGEALTPTFFGLAVLSMVVMSILVFIELRLADLPLYRQINHWLESYQASSLLILRIATGVTLLLSWQADTILMPDLRTAAPWIGWLQYGLAFILLFRPLVPVTGAGLLVLYLIGAVQYGIFHMLDYMLILGVGYFLLVSNMTNERIKGLDIPALYFTLGFSLCWVALEKVIYPQWGLHILSENPQLALGLPLEFFLLSAAFIEFSLGYLLIIGLLERPLALVITLTFFTTTLGFGKVEVIGHTIIHAALIVFLIEGPGHVYRAPITFHKNIGLRTAFASVNFAVLLILLIIPYAFVAQQIHLSYLASNQPITPREIEVNAEQAPEIELLVHEDPLAGWNLELVTTNFQLQTPTTDQSVDLEQIPSGYAQLYLNEQAIGRMYEGVAYLPPLNPGTYQLTVQLTTSELQPYTLNNEPIAVSRTLIVHPKNPLEQWTAE